MDSEKAPIVFKSTKKKSIRKRKDSSEDEESTEDNSSEIKYISTSYCNYYFK